MYYEDELERYEQEAEDRFDDYAGEYEEDWPYEDEEDHFDTGFGGAEYSYEPEEYYEEYEYFEEDDDDDSFDSYAAQTIGKIDPNDRTLTISVTNTTAEDQDVVIFGANEGLAPPAGVLVEVAESSHNEVREESKSNPFKIVGMKLAVSDPLQFDHVLEITTRSVTGYKDRRPYQPRNATSPQNFSQHLIDDAAFEMDVTGRDALRFRIKANAKVTFTFTIKARANMANLLAGKNVAELSIDPRTTGLPQIDLQQQKQPTAFGLKKRKPKPKTKVKKRIVPVSRPAVKRKPAPAPRKVVKKRLKKR